ncbi:MAG: DoxX family membrane protein [Vicinamibacteria bacterium]
MSRDLALLVLRLSGLGLALLHGWGKVVALSNGQGRPFIDAVAAMGFPAPGLFAWAAAFAEFGCGLLVFLGLGTRLAAGAAAFTMAVAAFGRHKAQLQAAAALGLLPASEESLKGWGNPELALVYLLALLSLALTGGGRFALDARLSRR